jgi:hypothetical protein
VTREPVPAEQRVYARWLAAGANVSLVLLATTFFLYVGGLVAPVVPLAELPRYWGLSAAQYVAATGAQTGWGWAASLRHSDSMNLAGIACVAMVTPVCFVRLLLEYIARREPVFALIAALELVVLVIAASGVLAG